MRALLTLLLCGAACAASCSDSEPPPPAVDAAWTAWDTHTDEARNDPRMLNAERARAMLFNKLLEALTGAMAEGGPVAAITVCRDQAPELAASVGEELGLRIGRSGVRLRNPENAPPAWATEGVAELSTRKRAWVHTDGTLGVLTPIQTGSACLTCHGGPEDLGDGVADALAKLYPDDAATGFADGDLRGWFWVESPAK